MDSVQDFRCTGEQLLLRPNSTVFGVGRADPVTYGVATLTLLLATIAASWRPARRASSPDRSRRYEPTDQRHCE